MQQAAEKIAQTVIILVTTAEAIPNSEQMEPLLHLQDLSGKAIPPAEQAAAGEERSRGC